MDDDRRFYAAILAMIAFLFGYPIAAVFIFLIGVLI
jgi:hypothetical protein